MRQAPRTGWVRRACRKTKIQICRKVTYQYDKVGELVQVVGWLGATTFELDLLNQLAKVTDRKGSVAKLVCPSGWVRRIERLNLLRRKWVVFMNMKTIKGVTSEFEQHGLYLYKEATSYIEYASLTNDIRIVFDITDRRPRVLRAFYFINIGGHWYSINLELFITGKKIQSEIFFEDKQELLDFTDKLVHLIIDDILPCSKELIDNPIRSTHSMHKRLSADPHGLAKAFSEHYHFPLNSLKESFNLLKELSDGIIPSDIAKRPSAFHENEDLIIGMAAYLGETALLEFDGIWKWLWSIPLPREFDDIDKDRFVVVSSASETHYFSPLSVLESHWTFHNKVSAFGLNNFIRPW